MGQPVIQPSFAAGELSPQLYGRVDLAKFHVGAALLRNFFVDYRGGASTRPGTMYVARSKDSSAANRLLPFTFSTVQTYALAFCPGPTIADTVTDAVDNGSGLVRLTVGDTSSLCDGCKMTVSGVVGTTEANGTWAILVIDATHVDLIGSAFANAYVSGGATSTPTGILRVVLAGALVLESTTHTITGATQANPCVITSAAHGFSNGDWVYISGVAGMTELNGKYFLVASATANTFALTDLDGNNINSTAYTAYTSGGLADRVYERVVPYKAADMVLPTPVKYTQNADTMTITHPLYKQAQLTRTAHDNWTYTLIDFVPSQGSPTIGTVTPHTGAASTTYRYVVTAVSSNGVTESRPSASAETTVAATMSTTAGENMTVTWTAPADTPQYYNIYRQAEVDGGAAATGALYGFVGSSVGLSFVDANILPDFTRTPPQADDPFGTDWPSTVNYYQGREWFAAPSSSPQRLVASRSGDFLNMDYSTPTQDNDSIDVTLAAQQVNAIRHLVPTTVLLALTSDGCSEVRPILINYLGVWRIDDGDVNGTITPSTIQARPQSANVLYVQEKSNVIRDLEYDFLRNIYKSDDITILASHLFFGHTVVDWCWAREPFKIVWVVREDGVLLSLTYLKEQDIYGWAQHQTDGRVKSICTISEGTEDAVYMIVERKVQGSFLLYIERLASRVYSDVVDAWCVDCGLAYPRVYPAAKATPSAVTGTPTITGVNLVYGGSGYTAPVASVVDAGATTPQAGGSGAAVSLTVVGGVITAATVTAGGSGYIRPEIQITDSTGSGAVISAIVQKPITVTADAAVFDTVADIGKVMRINDGVGTVTAVASTTSLTLNVTQDLSSDYPADSGDWTLTLPVTSVSGLDHLEGRTVTVLADGNVEPPVVVSNGAITLSHAADAIVAGLPYTPRLETLYLDIPGESPTVQGKRKKISAVTIRVAASRGLSVAPKGNPQTPGTLYEVKERDFQKMGEAIPLYTGDRRVVIDPAYTVNGQLVIEQDYPLPATVLALMPEVVVGDSV